MLFVRSYSSIFFPLISVQQKYFFMFLTSTFLTSLIMFNVKVSDNEPVSPYLEVQHVQEGVESGVCVASPEHHRVEGPGGLPVLRMQGAIQIVGDIRDSLIDRWMNYIAFKVMTKRSSNTFCCLHLHRKKEEDLHRGKEDSSVCQYTSTY